MTVPEDVKTVAVLVAELHAQMVVAIIVVANAKQVVRMIALQHAKGLAELNVIQHAQENAKELVGLLALIFVKTALIAVVVHAETVV